VATVDGIASGSLTPVTLTSMAGGALVNGLVSGELSPVTTTTFSGATFHTDVAVTGELPTTNVGNLTGNASGDSSANGSLVGAGSGSGGQSSQVSAPLGGTTTTTAMGSQQAPASSVDGAATGALTPITITGFAANATTSPNTGRTWEAGGAGGAVPRRTSNISFVPHQPKKKKKLTISIRHAGNETKKEFDLHDRTANISLNTIKVPTVVKESAVKVRVSISMVGHKLTLM
jgi:hypothetical protein